MCFGKKQSAFSVSSIELQKNEEIDKMIRKDRKRMKKEIKILLLGAGESGKSTILKQMKILHANGFSIDERREVRPIIFSNLIVAFKIIIDEMSTLEIGFELQESERFEAIILVTEDIGPDDPFPMECLPAMKGLWTDSGVQTAIKRGNEYALHDNLTYFFGNIDRLFARDYMPNDQDMLRSRLRTTGITETVFELGELTYHMFDVGGQRSERKKWIHCFEGVQCLMFLVALSGYDQCLVEDKAANQMQEAIMLFESIVNTSWFKRSSIILFLNKVDLFKEKLELSPVRDYFPDFQGANNDFDAACQFFADKFRDLNRNREKEIYPHFTNATDTNLLKVTMHSVQDMIIQNNLNNLIFENLNVEVQQQSINSRQAAEDMFTSSLSRIVRASQPHSLSSSFTSWASTNSVAASTVPTLCRRHQRRQSSSKASNPPDGGSRNLGAPAEASKSATPATKSNHEKNATARLGRRRGKDVAVDTAGKALDDPALNIPSVPSTQHRHPHDIQVASFFSIHRPISVTASVPPNSTPSAFSSIFAARSKSKPQPADVIYTLSSTVNMLESASGSQQPQSQTQQTSEAMELRTAVTQASVSNAEPGTKHLDGAPGNQLGMSLKQMTDRFRPFMPPPAPLPMSSPEAHAREQKLAEQLKNEQAKPQKKTYTMVITFLESTHPNGRKTWEARTGPIVESPPNSPSLHQRQAPSSTSSSFLERMRVRQEKWEDFREERAQTMELLSTKRQRKLKMKKHKYKKLMKRTRTLRRKLS